MGGPKASLSHGKKGPKLALYRISGHLFDTTLYSACLERGTGTKHPSYPPHTRHSWWIPDAMCHPSQAAQTQVYKSQLRTATTFGPQLPTTIRAGKGRDTGSKRSISFLSRGPPCKH